MTYQTDQTFNFANGSKPKEKGHCESNTQRCGCARCQFCSFGKSQYLVEVTFTPNFFFTLEMYLVLPQNRSSVPEIWPLNTKVISYRLVTYCIFPFTSLIIIQWGSGTFHKYCSWLSIAVKFGADGVKRTGTAHSVLSESFVLFCTCWVGLTTLVVCFRGVKSWHISRKYKIS